MYASDLRVGTKLANGRILVIAVKRHGDHATVTFRSAGIKRVVMLHKTQPVASVLVGLLATNASTSSYYTLPHNVRASPAQWRGETREARPRATWDDSPRGKRMGTETVPDDAPTTRTDSRY